ncbi:PAS domain S-box protein [candidate division KSB1 bacterium]|nr:PAS domain S-box protein [candidate division KSB1 bacterium]NIR68741.1 PAS domain S-box protein [candidate division KSB1 bacterium]NIS25558.1 PAS domain S-box protein [candidate division KSB1 bacterium]NIT72452.1 PAS domain S-box protein [candidate division KSB1 bacterium]NIU26235.1 PAS domain S-box protein [candidate division KSB1 bacterium]
MQKKSKNPGNLRERAEKILKEDSKHLKDIPPENIQSLIHELHVHQVELEVQNEELRQAQQELEASRVKYFELYDFAPIGYFTFDEKKFIRGVNLTGARLLGVERGFLIGMPFANYVMPDCQGEFYDYIRKVFDARTKQTCELKLKGSNGTPFFVTMESMALWDEEGNFSKCLSAISDITERKQTEQALHSAQEELETEVQNRTVELSKANEEMRAEIAERKQFEEKVRASEKRYRNLFKNTPIAIWEEDFTEVGKWLAKLHRKGVRSFHEYLRTQPGELKVALNLVRILDVNQAAIRLLEAESKEHLLSKFTWLFTEETYEAFIEQLTAIWENKTHVRTELTGVTLKGHRIDCILHWFAPKTNGRLDLSKVIVAISNVTELKQAHEELQQREEHFRSLIENASDIITIVDAEGKFTYQSPAVERVLGYKPKDLLGKNAFDLVHPDDVNLVQEKFRQVMEHPGSAETAWFRFRHKNGSWRVLESTGKTLSKDSNETGMVINSRNITQRKQAQEALQESEERFRRIFEEGPLGMAIISPDYRFVTVNDRLCQILGYTKEELTELKFPDITYPADIEQSLKSAEQLRAGKTRSLKLEKRYIRKSGEYVWVELTGSTIRDEQEKLRYYLVMIEDISERKRRNEEIQLLLTTTQAIHRAKNFRAALGIALDEICRFTGWDYGEVWIPHAGGKLIEYGSSWCIDSNRLQKFARMAEKKSFQKNEGLVGRVWASKKSTWIANIANVSKKIFHRKKVALEVGFNTALAMAIVDNDEVLAVLLLFMFESREEDQRQLELISSVATQLGTTLQRKKAEEAFRGLVESSPAAIMVAHDGEIAYLNPAGLKLLGYQSISEPGKHVLEDLFAPQHKSLVADLRKGKQELPHHQSEVQLIRKDDTPVDVAITFIRTTFQGKPALVGLALDITEKKHLEREAKRVEQLTKIGEFSASIAHELRNPLGSISLNCDLLSERLEIPEEYQEQFQDIMQGIDQLENIVKDILSFARPAEPQLRIENIHQVLDSALRMVEPELEQANIIIAKNYSATRVRTRIDADQIVQVFVNLFLNAKEAMGVSGKLTVSTVSHKDSVEVQVSDTGSGIPSEFMEKLFEPFFTTKKKGTGLGLAISHRILEKHNSKIFVESEEGKGTTFTVRFPLAGYSKSFL